MADDIKHIHSCYSPNDLYNRIIAGLTEIGKDFSRVTLDDLHPVDEFHIRGTVATKKLIKLCEVCLRSREQKITKPQRGRRE